MPKWNDLGNIWSTLREVDVSVIRAEAEQPFAIACVGHPAALDAVDHLLHTGDDRYGTVGINPVESIPFEQALGRMAALRGATSVIVALDARQPMSQLDADALAQIEQIDRPRLTVLLFGTALTATSLVPRTLAASAIAIADPTALEAAGKLGEALFERVPADLRLAAARRLPGLRIPYARELVNSSSVTNATYAIGTALPEQIPLLNVPFALADIIILTKNQAIMVYRLALAYGAKPDFQERIVEVAPVIGGGFLWRQLARTVVSLVPVWGIIPKVAIAYGGTYATGVAAWGWFARGDVLSADRVRKITDEAMAVGRQRAKELVDRARQLQPKPKQLPAPDGQSADASAQPTLRERIMRRLPGQGKPKSDSSR